MTQKAMEVHARPTNRAQMERHDCGPNPKPKPPIPICRPNLCEKVLDLLWQSRWFAKRHFFVRLGRHVGGRCPQAEMRTRQHQKYQGKGKTYNIHVELPQIICHNTCCAGGRRVRHAYHAEFVSGCVSRLTLSMDALPHPTQNQRHNLPLHTRFYRHYLDHPRYQPRDLSCGECRVDVPEYPRKLKWPGDEVAFDGRWLSLKFLFVHVHLRTTNVAPAFEWTACGPYFNPSRQRRWLWMWTCEASSRSLNVPPK